MALALRRQSLTAHVQKAEMMDLCLYYLQLTKQTNRVYEKGDERQKFYNESTQNAIAYNEQQVSTQIH